MVVQIVTRWQSERDCRPSEVRTATDCDRRRGGIGLRVASIDQDLSRSKRDVSRDDEARLRGCKRQRGVDQQTAIHDDRSEREIR